jgi:hypothetical protein
LLPWLCQIIRVCIYIYTHMYVIIT